MTFAARLARLLEERSNGNQAAFARLCEVEEASIRQWLKGPSMPSLKKLVQVAQRCEVSLDWLVMGDESKTPGASVGELSEVHVKRLSFRPSAGSGALAIDEEAGRIPFPASVLKRVRVKPENARFMTAAGESMRPTIEDGDPLVVDIADTDIIDGRIYVFSIGDQALVKRLRRRGAKLFMRSDNRELFPDEEEVPTVEPVRIVGRVRWVGRSL